jgi:perosamine synthetase
VGDGGMITTNDDMIAGRLTPLRWVGINKSTWHRTSSRYGWDYRIEELGHKAHMNDINASLGLAQLGRLDTNNRRRREIVDVYTQELGDLAWLQLPQRTEGDHEYAWHLYAVRTDRRDDLVEWMLEHDVSAGVHYRPLYQHEALARYLNGSPAPTVTDREWQRLVTIPLFPDMTEDDVGLVVNTIRSFPS